jgi:DNA-binding Xre family transcriptional regulator
MARYFIRVDYLAEKVGISAQSLSNMKNRDDMPRIDGDRLGALCRHLTLMARERDPSVLITPNDLIEYIPDRDAA